MCWLHRDLETIGKQYNEKVEKSELKAFLYTAVVKKKKFKQFSFTKMWNVQELLVLGSWGRSVEDWEGGEKDWLGLLWIKAILPKQKKLDGSFFWAGLGSRIRGWGKKDLREKDLNLILSKNKGKTGTWMMTRTFSLSQALGSQIVGIKDWGLRMRIKDWGLGVRIGILWGDLA